MTSILVAPQAFKGTLTAREVGQAMREGILRADSTATVLLFSLADGGDGTLDALIGKEETYFHTLAKDALNRDHEAIWGLMPDGKTAVIELAVICGLAQLKDEERDVLHATTFGVGQVILDALDKGIRRFIVGLGGSASNDAGVGAVQALGGRFLDASGKVLPLGGLALQELASMDLSGLDSRLSECEMIAACDVSNPLLGPAGATHLYVKQKGATDEQVLDLEKSMQHFAAMVQRDLHIDLGIPMSGSAGGTAAGLHCFLGAKLAMGADIVLDALKVDRVIGDVSLVLTGEGKLDGQTHFGKAPAAIAKLAHAHGVPVVAIVGSAVLDEPLPDFDRIIPLFDYPLKRLPSRTDTLEAIRQAAKLVVQELL